MACFCYKKITRAPGQNRAPQYRDWPDKKDSGERKVKYVTVAKRYLG